MYIYILCFLLFDFCTFCFYYRVDHLVADMPLAVVGIEIRVALWHVYEVYIAAELLL